MKLDQLGPYRIVKQIGKGGMGSVYEAVASGQDGNASKRVAIKALSPQLAMAEGFRERFEAEIESLKKLRHPGIVRLYGYGEQEGILFYSMELVDGPSLEEEINNGRRFDWREALQIGIQVCRALKHAHDHGVVHRDIKPANLMLTASEQIKIADFGIARLFGGTQLTTAGGVLGTADYMSPEQADGIAVTDKCDQYSLGGVMYALLAGRPPFKAKTMPEMLQLQRFAEPEPVRRYAVETPDQLDRLITQLLAKNPNDRFPNVLVLSRHMEAMEKALSRPSRSRGEETGETTASFEALSSEVTSAIDEQATRAADAPLIVKADTAQESSVPSIYDAPTLDQSSPSHVEPIGSPDLATRTQLPASEPPAKESHFTTVDEDARRQREQREGNRLAALAQLSILTVTLGAMLWGGWTLMRPPSADELFTQIDQSVSEYGIDDLPRSFTKDIEAFLKRFPNDPRVTQLQPLQEQLDFLAHERSARARSRFMQSAARLPLELIYFDALAASKENPEKAILDLQALVALYDPAGEITSFDLAKAATDRFASVGDPRLLVVARRRIESLSAVVGKVKTTHLPALQERLRSADRLRASDPVKSRQMYQAIVQLYGEHLWAEEIVRRAKQALSDQ
ncbi:MAG: serine/threonine-protein kinase [Planctomycetota bacterium]